MPFPDVDRVVYERNPLEQVICQLRFPPILRIDSVVPADFQDWIRDQYPFFDEKAGLTAQPSPEVLERLPADAINALFRPRKAYEFRSDDQEWVLVLTKDFLALTSNNYVRWEEFAEHLVKPFEALNRSYAPAFFSRIGLRYQNVIQKTKLDLGDISWSQLLKPYISAELSLPGIADSIVEAAHNVVVKLDEYDSMVRIQHGLVQRVQDGEHCYLIDNDFFTERRTEVEDVWATLSFFNNRSRRLFRWCVEDELHNAMGPQLV